MAAFQPANRGAVSIYPSPTLDEITTGVGQWTRADDANPSAVKETCQTIACATPVDWRPGQKVVVPPPKIVPEVQERLSHRGRDYDVKDFYLSFREGPPN